MRTTYALSRDGIPKAPEGKDGRTSTGEGARSACGHGGAAELPRLAQLAAWEGPPPRHLEEPEDCEGDPEMAPWVAEDPRGGLLRASDRQD